VLNNSSEIKKPEACISPSQLLPPDSPFWLAFERRLIFKDVNFNTESIKNQSAPTTNSTILGRIKFFRGVHLKLSYGALTSMNEYYYHPHYDFPKRSEWTVNLFLYVHKNKKER